MGAPTRTRRLSIEISWLVPATRVTASAILYLLPLTRVFLVNKPGLGPFTLNEALEAVLDGAVVDEEPIKHSDVLVEDPEEIEKHAKEPEELEKD